MPTSSLDASFGVMLDAFLMSLYDLAPSIMAHVIVEQAAALKRNPTTTGQVLARLEKVGITRFARAVRTYLDEDGTE